MDFAMAMNYIECKNKLGIIPGLDSIKELLRRLDNPQDKVKCLHIAGTNGKGSIFSYVEDILLEADFSVGRYVSPTIFSYLERFQINKKHMTEGEFARIISRVSEVVELMVEDGFNSPTAFEIETAAAFLYFYENKVDICLIECGMGGTEDATNVIEKPLATVFASISRDHVQFLGDTVEEITRSKAGILRKNGICVSYPQQFEEAVCVLREECEALDCSFYMVDKDDVIIKKLTGFYSEFVYKGYVYTTTLLGEHQVYNAATAILVIAALNENNSLGSIISEETICRAVYKTSWPGRMTLIHNMPEIYVDGAHNEDAWNLLYNTVNKYFTKRRIIYIIGVLKDKEYNKLVDILKPTMSYVVAVTPNNIRGLDKDILAELIREQNVECETAETVGEALNMAISHADSEDVIIVCGSLSFISDYLLYYK